ncbi:MAG: GerMN domain-containing protein [Eubacteriales bacterium]|nr:GerMN domain-containing protein [Eubacteriales bacterium]MDD3882738.1 GerMN domain-containing protein [Eubacteriales bacterium]MDD4512641.1 GerMN domain-containing protein [Eubacteriales bacterium]
MKKFSRADAERLLILCAAVLVVVLAVRSGVVDEGQEQVSVPYTETESVSANLGETQETVVYYRDGDGYLVPVTRSIPKTEGIAKATLSLMVKSSANDLAAAKLGLLTVVPTGTQFEVDIANGHARVDMSKEALSAADAESESLMVSAVVETLCAFDTVKDVELLFDGQKRALLPNGTKVSGKLTGGMVNAETSDVFSENSVNAVTVFYPSTSGRMLVPVTRAVYGKDDIETAVLELIKGPKKDSGLQNPYSKDCGLISLKVEGGVATVNFTKGFMDTLKESDGGKQALRAILYTCTQYPNVKKVEIQIDGQKYTPEREDTATFLNQENDIIANYTGVIEIE